MIDKIIRGCLLGLLLIGMIGTIYNAIGYYITLRKIEATCHEALAFEHPTPYAVGTCHAHGFYK